MRHACNAILLLAALVATVALYAITYDTRRLEAKLQAEERALERIESDVAILRAERAHLARPERLEPLARELGLAPIGSGQYLRLEGAAASEASAQPGLSPQASGAALSGTLGPWAPRPRANCTPGAMPRPGARGGGCC
jgi:cell division protein FtsL